MATVVAPVDRSTLPLSEVARHVVMPEGIVDSLWFEVEERCQEFGIEFDAWQDGLGQIILGLREDGTFASTVGGITLSIPRQVAKTFIVMCIVIALCSIFPNLTVLWTAHRLRTATNTFQKMKAMCLRPPVRAHIKAGGNQGTAIRDANGEQEIPFANGSRILFGAREQGFGRGFDEVDIEVFDEAQILTIKALEDMVAATNQSRWEHGALLFYMGTPPRPEDPGEVFSARRSEALALKGELPPFGRPAVGGDAVFVECSADENVGKPGGPALDDRGQVEKANPSYPHRTPPVAVKRLRKNLPDNDSWRREGLGVWDEFKSVARAFPYAAWLDLRIDSPPTEGVLAFGVKFSVDGARVALSVALKPDEGPVYVECLGVAPLSQGTMWLVDQFAEQGRHGPTVVIDGKSGAGDFVNALLAAGVSPRRILIPTVDEVITAHAGMLAAVHTGDVEHSGQPGLDASVRAAGKRTIGKAGGWGLESMVPGGDITPIESAIFARHGVTSMKRRSNRARSGEVVIA